MTHLWFQIAFCVAIGLIIISFYWLSRRKGSQTVEEQICEHDPLNFFNSRQHFAAIILLLFYGTFIFSPPKAQEVSTLNFTRLLLATLFQHLFFIGLIIISFQKQAKNWIKSLNWNPSRKWILAVSTFLGLIAIASFQIVLANLHFYDYLTSKGLDESQRAITLMQQAKGHEKILMCFLAVIVAPLAEEIVFRGFFYNYFKKLTNIPIALIASGLIFGAIHLNTLNLVMLSLMGMLLAYVYQRFNTIWASIAIHLCWNGFTALAMLLIKH